MKSTTLAKCNYASSANLNDTSKVCSGRGKSYCLIHRRYFETSWCPDCGRASSNCRSLKIPTKTGKPKKDTTHPPHNFFLIDYCFLVTHSHCVSTTLSFCLFASLTLTLPGLLYLSISLYLHLLPLITLLSGAQALSIESYFTDKTARKKPNYVYKKGSTTTMTTPPSIHQTRKKKDTKKSLKPHA
ncbi:hypothetical protein VTP01DRAFT_14 [Rhizomucor pusillus]|uniref:uncharacterized protein n=1 Tax=Rhizomucor pusillus TaxID=4840 RepID=UPI003742B890